METLRQLAGRIDWEAVIGTGIRLLVILLVLLAVTWLANRLLNHLRLRLSRRVETRGKEAEESAKRADTLVHLLKQLVFLVIWILGVLTLLREVGLDIAPILAGAGILGLAVGFGAQNLVRDIISGFFFILENQIRVGDVAIVNGTGGLVEAVNFRTTVLRDLSGTVHVFPNGTVTTLANMTREWSAYVFDIGVAYKEDADEAIRLIREVGTALQDDDYFGPLIKEPIEVFGVDQLAESAVIIKGRIKTWPIRQWEVGRELLRRVKKTFDEQGVEIPYPHRTLYFGEASRPVHLDLERYAARMSEE